MAKKKIKICFFSKTMANIYWVQTMCQVPCKMFYIISSHAHNKCISIKPESSFISFSIRVTYFGIWACPYSQENSCDGYINLLKWIYINVIKKKKKMLTCASINKALENLQLGKWVPSGLKKSVSQLINIYWVLLYIAIGGGETQDRGYGLGWESWMTLYIWVWFVKTFK